METSDTAVPRLPGCFRPYQSAWSQHRDLMNGRKRPAVALREPWGNEAPRWAEQTLCSPCADTKPSPAARVAGSHSPLVPLGPFRNGSSSYSARRDLEREGPAPWRCVAFCSPESKIVPTRAVPPSQTEGFSKSLWMSEEGIALGSQRNISGC